ncbi:hypothetical protein Mapa_006436 [Marchantia paleacea]|nr:hypothetical protein Mapa_006436 [Marchantia paleacea]
MALIGSSVLHPFFTTSIIDPFESMSLFDRAFLSFPRGVGTVANTRIDWVETPQAHVLKADLPGMKKEEIKVQISDDGILTISGERSKEEVNEKGSFGRVELSYGKVHRQLKLPSDAKIQEVSAKVENGVLTMTVPKTELSDETPQLRDVEISG